MFQEDKTLHKQAPAKISSSDRKAMVLFY